MWPDNRFRDMFAVNLPIVQAPMAGASTLDMALAVSAAGGLGSLACATLDPDRLRGLLKDAYDRSASRLNVNFFAHAMPNENENRNAVWLGKLSAYYAEFGLDAPKTLPAPIQPFDAVRCEVIEEFSPAVVSFHFGLPEPALVSRIKAVGCKIISSATTVNEARWLVANGCDAIIAQGFEAGGHRGMFLSDDLSSQMGTMSLVPQIADAVDVPVIAAGGIGDARGVVAAFALGASAVQIGTAYLFTDEASISQIYRKSLANAANETTAVCNLISGRPTRILANRLICELGPMQDDVPTFPKGFAATGPLRDAAEKIGKRDFSAHYCGQSASLGRWTTSFALTRDLASGALMYHEKKCRST